MSHERNKSASELSPQRQHELADVSGHRSRVVSIDSNGLIGAADKMYPGVYAASLADIQSGGGRIPEQPVPEAQAYGAVPVAGQVDPPEMLQAAPAPDAADYSFVAGLEHATADLQGGLAQVGWKEGAHDSWASQDAQPAVPETAAADPAYLSAISSAVGQQSEQPAPMVPFAMPAAAAPERAPATVHQLDAYRQPVVEAPAAEYGQPAPVYDRTNDIAAASASVEQFFAARDAEQGRPGLADRSAA